ncbi:MAG TPA: hypothetical protein VF503_27965 [Sphingobium sp.]
MTSGARIGAAPPAVPDAVRETNMQDILWIGLILGMLAATLGYAALCDHA